MFGSDLMQAGTVNVIITATEAESGKTVDITFKITALDCSPVGLTLTPSNVTLF